MLHDIFLLMKSSWAQLTKKYLASLLTEVHGPSHISCYLAHGTQEFCYHDQDIIYDLASLTKVLCTTTLLMLNVQRGRIRLTDHHADFPQLNLSHLLTHTSGLPAWQPLYLQLHDKKQIIAFLKELKLQNPPGKMRLYSDLGFMILGDFLEKLYQMNLDEIFQSEIGNDLYYHPPDPSQVIATSIGNPFEKARSNQSRQFRNYRLQGEVNDGNAFHLYAGAAPHAGLFGSTKGVLAVMNLWTQNDFISAKTLNLFLQTKIANNSLGFASSPEQLKIKLPFELYGHHGFTGCTLLFNPQQNFRFIYLSNRQYRGLNHQGQYPDWKPALQELLQAMIG